MRDEKRGRWERLLAVVVWVLLCALVTYESRTAEVPVELVCGLLAITVTMATAWRWPLVALAVACVSGVGVLFNFGGRVPLWPILLMIVAGFFAGRRAGELKPALLVFGGAALAGLPVAVVVSEDVLAGWGAMVATMACAAGFTWQMGRYFKLREDLVRNGWERAEQLETEQRIVADEARLRERARIAADMHDSLGHELSLLALRAGALEMAPELSERRRAEAGELRQSAGVATERLHEIIGMLREDATAPMEPVGEDIAALVERARASGLRIDAELAPAEDVPPMVDRAAYRVVQEALTNVAKHAPGAAAEVRVQYTDGETVVSVRNDPPPAGPLPGRPGGRRGLTGLRERVRLVGGSLEAGPGPRGFEVRARLPHDAAPTADSTATEAERSEAARALDLGRRKANRTLLVGLGVPVSLLAVFSGISAVFYTHDWVTSKLDAPAFFGMELGQQRADLVAVLPSRQKQYRARLPEPPVPEGAVCEYYGTDEGLLEFSDHAYRLCFAGGRLVGRDLIADEGEQR
ncbi:sensor histidine kinase [Amycolatopsis sp. 195334CR]|uniref:sensor histidine kinase n=1 Tax=Amycolatopsis sp. 195334CR TaxID=2814588 RepID=UPI001A8E2F61|nr:histidine kinase [Amycolatopsis sp. 195334CR]MBN6034226.1 sensor histidine kinase [Amycolatopsis sp. 195334CR]